MPLTLAACVVAPAVDGYGASVTQTTERPFREVQAAPASLGFEWPSGPLSSLLEGRLTMLQLHVDLLRVYVSWQLARAMQCNGRLDRAGLRPHLRPQSHNQKTGIQPPERGSIFQADLPYIVCD